MVGVSGTLDIPRVPTLEDKISNLSYTCYEGNGSLQCTLCTIRTIIMNRDARRRTFTVCIAAFLFRGRGREWWKAVGAMVSTALPFRRLEGSPAESSSSSSLRLEGMGGGEAILTAAVLDGEDSVEAGSNVRVFRQV